MPRWKSSHWTTNYLRWIFFSCFQIACAKLPIIKDKSLFLLIYTDAQHLLWNENIILPLLLEYLVVSWGNNDFVDSILLQRTAEIWVFEAGWRGIGRVCCRLSSLHLCYCICPQLPSGIRQPESWKNLLLQQPYVPNLPVCHYNDSPIQMFFKFTLTLLGPWASIHIVNHPNWFEFCCIISLVTLFPQLGN